MISDVSKDFEEVNVLMVESNQSPINQNNRIQINQNSILKNVKFIIAVASGKGGVGKSTTATNLACAISQEGGSVGILDADIYGPSQTKMLGTVGKPDSLDGKKMEPITNYGIQSISIGNLIKYLYSGLNCL